MSQKALEKMILTLTLLVFSWYWASTFLYISPPNYIRIQLNTYLNLFGSFFEQKWNFFAPPPTHNTRLYYTFTNRENVNTKYTFEVLGPLLKLKSEKNPFNTREDTLDYLLAGSIININEALVNAVKAAKAYHPNESEEFYQNKAREYLLEQAKEVPELQTLKNYAHIVAAKNNLTMENFYVDLSIALKEIPKFIHRYDPPEKEEKIIFQAPVNYQEYKEQDEQSD